MSKPSAALLSRSPMPLADAVRDLGEWHRHSCRCCARPAPLVRLVDQFRSNGVLFDVPYNLPELLLAPNPVIEALVLPESLSHASKNLVGAACRIAFDALGDPGHGCAGSDYDMDVVRHNDIGKERVKLELVLTESKRIDDALSNGRILQPQRSATSRRHRSIEGARLRTAMRLQGASAEGFGDSRPTDQVANQLVSSQNQRTPAGMPVPL